MDDPDKTPTTTQNSESSPKDEQPELNTLPDKNENYNDVLYWNERYSKEDSYEWCKDYSTIKNHLAKYVKTSDKILIIGCGNSNFSIDMYKDGFLHITNIDYSSVVIDKLKAKFGHLMEYHVMDMRQLHFNDNRKFDVVIEKSTLDVLFASESSPWTISDRTTIDIENTLSCIKNILQSSGHGDDDESSEDCSSTSKFISITFAEPYFRKRLYSKYWDNINVQNFGDFFHYYFYVMH